VIRRRRIAIAAAALLAIALANCRSHPREENPPLADFTLSQTDGGTFHLHSNPPQPVLLAFLQTVPDSADTNSRREVVFVVSMQRQFASGGLRVAAIDATALATGAPPSHDALVNAAADWQLNFPLLEDSGSRVAREFHVTALPTIILLAPDGRVARRWNAFVLPAPLADAIRQLLSAHPTNG
jgi:peroxiredoxin